MSVLHAVVGLVVLQRLGELALAAVNTRGLLAVGAFEVDRGGYPLFVGLHAAWFASLTLFIPPEAPPSWPFLGVFGLLQLGRVWAIATLRGRWTTRLIVLPYASLVWTGPYRFCRHPNYLVVVGEIVVLPLAFGAVGIALGFSFANLILLARRIRIEDRALAGNRREMLQPLQS